MAGDFKLFKLPACCCRNAEHFVESAVAMLGLIVQNSTAASLQAAVSPGVVKELFVCNLKRGTAQSRTAASAVIVGIAHKVRSYGPALQADICSIMQRLRCSKQAPSDGHIPAITALSPTGPNSEFISQFEWQSLQPTNHGLMFS